VNHQLWNDVDTYLVDGLGISDPVLDTALANSAAAGLPPIAVAPNQGKLLNLLARFGRAKSILEVGTLGGYSTIWLGRALPPDGRLLTLEAEPKHAEVARANIEAAGLGEIVEVRLGRALETLPGVDEQFDLIFIDADKAGYPDYFQQALRLSHPGTLIIADNVVRGGKVLDPASDDADVRGVQLMHELIAAEPRADATAIQTVGSKGHDGFTTVLITA
jgi:predicted O-methyltransferase YrrM